MPRRITPRQLAARKARAARGPLSPETRARLREAILARAPWAASTGPKTAAGKARSRRNALRHGFKAKALLPAPLLALFDQLRAADDGAPLPPPWEVVAVLRPILADDALPLYVQLSAAEAHVRYTGLQLDAETRAAEAHLRALRGDAR